MDVNQQLASVRSDVEKVSKKTIDELNKVAVEGLKTVQSVTAGVEKVQGKVAADAKSALSDAKSAVEKAKADVKQAADKVKQVVDNAQKSVQKTAASGALGVIAKIQGAVSKITGAIAAYKDTILNAIDKVKSTVAGVVGPLIDKAKAALANIEARLRQLVEMAMAAFEDIKSKVEKVINDVTTCFDVLSTNGPAAFEHAKQAIAAAREAAQAASKRDFQLAASRAGDAQKAAMAAVHEGEVCFDAIKRLIGGLSVAADGLTSSLKRHLEAAQSAAKEAVAATREDVVGVVQQAKAGATEIRGAVDAGVNEISTATQATAQKLSAIVTVTASAAAKQAVDTARSIVSEIESTSNELRGITLDTMGKVSEVAHQLDTPGPSVDELHQTVGDAMSQQDDARTKLQKIKELQGKLAGLS